MRKMSPGRRRALSALAAIGIPAGWPATPAFAQSGKEIRIGYGATLAWAVDLIAVEERLYEKAGLNFKVNRFESGKAIRDAMVGGATDIGPMAATPFVLGASKGDLVAVAVTSYFGGVNYVQVRADSTIQRNEDLRGRKVGTQVGSLTHSVFIEKIAPAHGLKPGDYQIVNIGNTGLVPALAAGTVDCVTSLEPFAGIAENEKIARTLTSFSKFDAMPTLLVTRAQFIEQSEAEVVGMLRAWLAAAKIYRDDRARTLAVLQRMFEKDGYTVPASVLARGVDRLRVETDLTPELRVYLQEQAETLRRAGHITTMPDWNKSLRPDILRKASS